MAFSSGEITIFPYPVTRFLACSLVLYGLVLSVAPARAENNGTTEIGAPPAVGYVFSDTLIVRSGPLPDPVNPSLAGLVTRVDLENEPGFHDAADILSGVAGVQVRRYGAVGASAVPSLRGSSGSQIRFYLDGMPLNDAQTGMTGLARIPLDRIAAVEIHRGVVPTELGGIGGAGAVNFITRPETEGLDFLARA